MVGETKPGYSFCLARNNCIDRYSLQHAQRRPHHLNNWNTSDVFLQAKRTGDDLFKGHQSMQNGDYGDQWHLRGKKKGLNALHFPNAWVKIAVT